VVEGLVKRTPLYETHRRLGARMTEFAGFAMPIQYSGILEEHRAVRKAAGLFDLSHMGEFEVRGSGAIRLLERALTNAAAQLSEGRAQYTILCAEDGGTIDDLIVYRLGPEHFMLCVNASNIANDWAQLVSLQAPDLELRDISDETALVAIQGPRAERILADFTRLELAKLGRFRTMSTTVAGTEALIARTGYTGEDGFEVYIPAAKAVELFEGLLDAGKAEGILPVGLGARDTLRMEAGLPLYGHELDRQTTPLEAGLNSFVKFGHGCVGEKALVDQRDHGVRKRLIGIRTDDAKSIARQGYRLFLNDQHVGSVTSGTYAPTFDRPLAMAYVEVTTAPGSVAVKTGDRIEVEIRNRKVPATVVPLPFYRRKPQG